MQKNVWENHLRQFQRRWQHFWEIKTVWKPLLTFDSLRKQFEGCLWKFWSFRATKKLPGMSFTVRKTVWQPLGVFWCFWDVRGCQRPLATILDLPEASKICLNIPKTFKIYEKPLTSDLELPEASESFTNLRKSFQNCQRPLETILELPEASNE